jgi:hypothetical protein
MSMTASTRQVGGGHYREFAIQPAEFCHRNRLGFLESCVVKYVCRHGAKAGREDVLKAIHYLELLLEWEYPDAPCSSLAADAAPGPDAGDGYGLYRDRPDPACVVCEDE